MSTVSSPPQGISFQGWIEATPLPGLILAPASPYAVLAVNTRFLAVGGCTRESLLDRPLLQALPPQIYGATGVEADLLSSLEQVGRKHQPHHLDIEGTDEPARHWRLFTTPLIDGAGSLCGLLHQLEERTEVIALQQAADRLAEVNRERQIFAALIENSSDFIGIANPEGIPIYVNPAGRRMVGLSDDKPVGETRIPEYYPPELRDFTHDVILKSMLEQGHWKGETQFRHWQTGAAIPVSDEHFMIRDPEDGHLLGMGTITRDISDQRQVREEIEASNRRLQQANDEIRQLYRTATDLSLRLQQERDRLNEAQALAHVGHWELDLRTQTLTWSDEVFRLFGLDPNSHAPSYETFLACVHAEDRATLEQVYRESVERRQPYAIEHRLVRPDGCIRHVHESGQTHYDADGEPLRTVGTVQDITDRKLAETSMRQAAAVIQATNEAVVVADAEGGVLSVNPAFTHITGYEPEEVIGRNPRMWQSGRHDTRFYQDLWSEVRRNGQWHGEIWNQRKSGEIFPVWENISVIRDAAGRVVNFVSIFTDITTVKATEERLAYLAHHDTLTGLPNRTLFTNELDHALRYAHRNDTHVALLILDLDRFKLVNDTLGHDAGDQLLQQVAQRLKQCVRESDTVARLGGDEFAIICTELPHAQDATLVARKIIEVLAYPIELADRQLVTSTSIGISLYPDDTGDAATLVKAADAAMYKAKASGRNAFEYYTADLSSEAAERMALETGLRRALERNEFVLHYQPQVDTASGRITGVEALLRWQHPELGLQGPGSFVPVAEDSGLIQPIGAWVLDAALAQTAEWVAQGLPLTRIAVNVSGQQILHNHLVNVVVESLERQRERLGDVRLELEITENILLSFERSVQILQELQEQGVLIAIDDFGTGYSSLSRLKHLPVDRLKIDRAFLHGLPGAADNKAIVAAIIAMGRSLDLQVIAEGVETAEQYELLRTLGCGEAQGYWLARPMPADEMATLLRRGLSLPADPDRGDPTG